MPGPTGPAGPSAVSTNAGNIAVLGSDSLIFVPADRVQSVATRTGNVTLTHADITDWASTLAPYAPLASPVFTGNPTSVTPALNDNNTSVATTAYVIGQASTTTPLMDGSASYGSATTFARADHVHPAQTNIAYSQLPSEVQQVPIGFPFAGKPAASQVLNLPMVMSLTIPALTTSNVRVFASTAATTWSNMVFTLNRIPSGSTTPTSIGTITLTSQTAATVTGAGASMVAGDILQMAAPGTQDATAADIGISILANRV